MWARRLPKTADIAPGESLLGFLVRLAHANGMSPDELAMAVGIDVQGCRGARTGWIVLATRPTFAPLVAKLSGYDSNDIRWRMICNDSIRPGRLLIDGHSYPAADVDVIGRRRPSVWDGIYKTAWLFKSAITDGTKTALQSVCSCGRTRLWADSQCCEMQAPQARRRGTIQQSNGRQRQPIQSGR